MTRLKIYIFSIFIFCGYGSASLADTAHPDFDLIFNQLNEKAHLTWTQGPFSHGESQMRIQWTNLNDSQPIDPANPFEVTLFMPSMGHGSSPTQLRRVLDSQDQILPGLYQVTSMYFMMLGDWLIEIKFKLQNGKNVIQTYKIHID